VVALEDQSVPAVGSGISLAWVFTGPIDDAGRVTFRAGLEGAGVDEFNDRSILRSDGAGGLDLVLREGDPAPGTGGAEFDSFGSSGQPAGLEHIVFSTTVRGASVGSDNDQGIWLWEEPGTLSLVALDGDPAPDTAAGVLFYNPRQFEANSSGQLGFRSHLTGPGVDSTNPDGIWFHDPATGTQLVAWAGQPAPGAPAGTNFFRLPTPPEINDAGEIAFSARTAVGVYPGGIWSADGPGEPLTLRHLTGDPAPGTSPGVTFRALFLSDMNSSGELGFVGAVSGPGITDDNNEGIWGPDGTGGVALIAREGDPATGVAGDARWGHATTSPFATFPMNDAGEVAFKAGLIGSDVGWDSDWGIWGPDGSGGLTLIAREGDPVPGLLGVSFMSIDAAPYLNAHGDVVFEASWLEVTEEGQNFGWGLFVRTGEGAFLTVVRSGDLIEVEPGIFREVSDPSRGGLNDARQFTFMTRFTGGGTGVFLTTVPEPGTAALLALGLAALTLATRKRG
jgi:hypothetical protein